MDAKAVLTFAVEFAKFAETHKDEIEEVVQAVSVVKDLVTQLKAAKQTPAAQ